MMMLDMREASKAESLRLDRAALTEAERQSAIATWKGRMLNEHISARVFAGLIPQMMEAGVDVRLQREVATMIDEELRHGVLCAAAVEALGGEARVPLPTLDSIAEHPDAEPVERLLRNVISICCLSETVAVALITAERHETEPLPLQDALTRILSDEIGHARFGWRLLDSLEPKIDDALRKRLGDYLPVAFTHLLRHELAHLPVHGFARSDAEKGHGVCDGRDARALFFECVEEVIVPELEARGLPGRLAWQCAQVEHAAERQH